MRTFWFLATPPAIATAATLVLAALAWCVLRVFGRRPQRYWRRTLRVHLVLVPLFALVATPLMFGWFAAFGLHTRGDEAGYAGPRIAADGSWQVQDRESLRSEAAGARAVEPGVLEASQALAVRITAGDGLALRGFLVPPLHPPARFGAVLSHGLFRGALEIETAGRMLRDLGGEVLLLELRNHGGSGRASGPLGLREAQDVAAGAAFLRARQPDLPLLVYGVSLGAIASALAAPAIQESTGLDALVLDAPADDLGAVAERLLREGVRMPQPWRWLTLRSVELLTLGRLSGVSPLESVRRLRPEIPVLVIGEENDDRMTPQVLQRIFDALPTLPDRKKLWICPDATHGHAFTVAPGVYREELSAIVERMLATFTPAVVR